MLVVPLKMQVYIFYKYSALIIFFNSSVFIWSKNDGVIWSFTCIFNFIYWASFFQIAICYFSSLLEKYKVVTWKKHKAWLVLKISPARFFLQYFPSVPKGLNLLDTSRGHPLKCYWIVFVFDINACIWYQCMRLKTGM